MRRYKQIIILLNLIILLVYFNHSVAKKEELLKDGQLILLELAPVDPRSLMQGDYMALRYKIAENINSENVPKRGYCVIKLDSKGVAKKIRFQKNVAPLSSGEYLIEFASPDKWNINIGAESFFFQEGHAKKYESAKYGALKVDAKGNSLLVGLYDEELKIIR